MQQVAVSKKAIKSLGKRAIRLAEAVICATERSPKREVRKEGARLAEILEEWVEELDELYEADDADVTERARSFAVRLQLAEERVISWWASKNREQKPQTTVKVRAEHPAKKANAA